MSRALYCVAPPYCRSWALYCVGRTCCSCIFELRAHECRLLRALPKAIVAHSCMQLLQAKREGKEHEYYQSKYVSKWIPRWHDKAFLGLAITFLLSTGNEINEKQKMLEIWCCVVFALFLSENFPRRAENQRLRWCCCREATWNRVLKTGTRGGKTARGISVSHTETRAKKLCFYFLIQ